MIRTSSRSLLRSFLPFTPNVSDRNGRYWPEPRSQVSLHGVACPALLTSLRSRLADEIIEIEVGQPVITFRIHKKLLQDHSSYFLKALEEKKYKEGKEKKVELHDVVPEAFDVVADWLYTRRQHRNFSDDGLRTVVEARLLADRLMCTSDWKNRIATKICEMFARAQDTTIYRESIDILDTVEMQDGCLMRQLLIDMVSRKRPNHAPRLTLIDRSCVWPWTDPKFFLIVMGIFSRRFKVFLWMAITK